MQNSVTESGEIRCKSAWMDVNSEIGDFFLANPAGSSLAVWTFVGTESMELTNGFGDQDAARAALSPLGDIPCANHTPLAEAVCDAVDALVAAFPGMPAAQLQVSITSDGLETRSDGPCAGDRDLFPPLGYSPSGTMCPDPTNPGDPEAFLTGSWQQRVCDHAIGNAVVLAKLWDQGSQAASAIDSETGLAITPAVPDEIFFTALANASGGAFTLIDDHPLPSAGRPAFGAIGACCVAGVGCFEGKTEADCAFIGGIHQGLDSLCSDANCGPTIPSVSAWGLAILATMVVIVGSLSLRRRAGFDAPTNT